MNPAQVYFAATVVLAALIEYPPLALLYLFTAFALRLLYDARHQD